MFFEAGRASNNRTRKARPGFVIALVFIHGFLEQIHGVVLFVFIVGITKHRGFDGQHVLLLFINIEPDITVTRDQHQERLNSNLSEGRRQQYRPINAVGLGVIQALFDQTNMLAGDGLCFH